MSFFVLSIIFQAHFSIRAKIIIKIRKRNPNKIMRNKKKGDTEFISIH